MAKTERQRQKKLAKKRTKKNKQQRELARKKNELNSLAGRMRAISKRPVAVSCFGAGAYETQGMSSVYFGRTMQDGQIMLTIWLLDNACLGVKDAFERVVSKSQLKDIIRDSEASQEFIHAEPSTVLSLIEQSMEYAQSIGFNPIPAARKLLPIFGDIDSTECREAFAFGGPEGKPIYIRGPHDTRERVAMILSTLKENVGEGNYNYTMFLGDADVLSLSSFDEVEEIDDVDVVEGQVERQRIAG